MIDLPTTKDLLYALATVRHTIVALKDKGKPYDRLIDLIVTFPTCDSEEKIPTGQQIQGLLKINGAKLKKWTSDLYDDLIWFVQENAVTFTNYRVKFNVNGHDDCFQFLAELPSLPRIGEMVRFPFLDSVIGKESLTVENIVYQFENDKVDIIVDASTLTPYTTQLKHRAIFEKRLTQNVIDSYSSDYIEDLLYKWYGNTR